MTVKVWRAVPADFLALPEVLVDRLDIRGQVAAQRTGWDAAVEKVLVTHDAATILWDDRPQAIIGVAPAVTHRPYAPPPEREAWLVIAKRLPAPAAVPICRAVRAYLAQRAPVWAEFITELETERYERAFRACGFRPGGDGRWHFVSSMTRLG